MADRVLLLVGVSKSANLGSAFVPNAGGANAEHVAVARNATKMYMCMSVVFIVIFMKC